MIPKWEDALESAKSLMSSEGRLLVADFDTYTEKGDSIKDFLIKTWYKQDGVRIEAKSRDVITTKVFSRAKYTITVARFQRKLLGVSIPHYVACCRHPMCTLANGSRKESHPDLSKVQEEKKMD
jgi:hypothetical protein